MQKLEIVSPYAHPLCTITLQRLNLKVHHLKCLYFFFFFFSPQVNVVRIIKLSPFKIIIITNTCTKSFQTLMEENSSATIQLICLASNIRKEVLWNSR
jgi:hypothetical protein